MFGTGFYRILFDSVEGEVWTDVVFVGLLIVLEKKSRIQFRLTYAFRV